MHRVLFLASPGDDAEIEAIREESARDHTIQVFVRDEPAGPGDYAKKINLGYRATSEPWIFQAADDLRFTAGWDVEAIRVGERYRVGVVGTNDLGNPDVVKGRHATHLLFRRSYIEQHGGTFDGSGDVFCEFYDHQWIDNEFVQTAIFRKQWAFAESSVVEHLHPHWGKAKMDPTYEKATRATAHDQALFKQRMTLIDPRFRRMNERRRRQRQ